MSKIIDITGQRFGSLTVLYPTRVNGRFGWHCQCDCGNEKDIESNNLRTGKVKSCGCQRNKNIGNSVKKNIIGQKYNHLTVLEATEQRQCGAIVWKCQCDCGNITYVSTGNLKSNHIKTCGKCEFSKENQKRLDIKGKKFGKLTVIDYYESKNGETIWQCQCDCGNQCQAVGWHLTTGAKKSCGCLKSQGEEKIISILVENDIPFETQKTFDDCRFLDTNKLASFDFFINNKYLLEYDGSQHFLQFGEGTGYMTDDRIKKIQDHDNFKNQWCKEHNIPLIRIPYTKIDTLELKDLLLQED